MAKQEKSSTIRPERLAQYDSVIATQPGVERKGAAIRYTSINGNMFSYLFGDGSLALRLPAPDRSAVIAQLGTWLHTAYGVIQKEYVDIPDELLADTAALAPYFAASFVYASGLKAKPTTRRAKS